MSNNMPKVSVIIPVYNVEKYLRKCLDSVINQTYKNLEIICVDDGSPDNSGGILDEYAQIDSRIIVIHQKNAGVSIARNRALDIATGEYIAFVDSDDWLEPQCYELAVTEMLRDPEIDLVSWGCNVINERNCSEREYKSTVNWLNCNFSGKKKLTPPLSKRLTANLWSMLFKATVITNNSLRFRNYKYAEDMLFLFEGLLDVHYIYYINLKLYNYVLNPSSALVKFNEFNNPLLAYKIRLEQLKEIYHVYKDKEKLKFFAEIVFNRVFSSLLYTLSFVPYKNMPDCLDQLESIVSFLDPSCILGEEIDWIRKKQFWKFKQLNLPYVDIGNSFCGLKVFRNENPYFVLNILGIKISVHYQKIFSVKNDKKKNCKVLNICGLKIKFSKNKTFTAYIKKFLSKVFFVGNSYKGDAKVKIVRILGITFKHKITFESRIKQFIKLNKKFVERKNKKVKRRLFMTTGNLSLLNNLTIIKQLNEPNCEDVLFVYTNMKNEKFIDCAQKMASLHNFKKEYYHSSTCNDFREYFLKNKLYDFDEVYFPNQFHSFRIPSELLQNSDWILTDEGCGCKLARSQYLNYDKIQKIITHIYLDKLDFFGLTNKNMEKIVQINKKIFENICNECVKLYPVHLNLVPTDKAIIFCGSWWEVTGLSKERYMSLQNNLFDKLLDFGYKILFKPHPRDSRNYLNNSNIVVLNTQLPLECYKFDDVVAIVSFGSSASLQSPYFSNLAGFNALPFNPNRDLENKWLDLLVKKMVYNYTTPIDVLFTVDSVKYSRDELRTILFEKCQRFINLLPKLSENEEFKQFALSKNYKISY